MAEITNEIVAMLIEESRATCCWKPKEICDFHRGFATGLHAGQLLVETEGRMIGLRGKNWSWEKWSREQ